MGDGRLDEAAKCLQQLLAVLNGSGNLDPFASPQESPGREQSGHILIGKPQPHPFGVQEVDNEASIGTCGSSGSKTLEATLPPGPFLGSDLRSAGEVSDAEQLVAALNRREVALAGSLRPPLDMTSTLRPPEDGCASAGPSTMSRRNSRTISDRATALVTAEASKLLKLIHEQEEELAQLKQNRSDEFSRLHKLLQRREEELAELRAQHIAAMAAARDKSEQSAQEQAAECVKLRGELASLRVQQDNELSRKNALLQTREQELAAFKTLHTQEMGEVQIQLRRCEAEIASLKAEKAMPKEDHSKGDFDRVREALQVQEEENLRFKAELHAKKFELQRLESQQEKELDDCAQFVKRLAISSSSPAIEQAFDLTSAEFLGMGNYGYVLTCRTKKSGDRVVLKIQSDRWVGLAISEWAHGSEVGVHPHIVGYIEALMHRDQSREMKRRLQSAFDDGVLMGRRPVFFPEVFFCLALEYMDRGTVQHFMDKRLLTPKCVGAITRQIASALAFMHKKKRTHNDIKPENILLCASPNGDQLISKLADLGLANHSMDRKRDCELFSYTVWCMGLRRDFDRCPPAGTGREDASSRFASSLPAEARYHAVWNALARVVRGFWQSSWEMAQVADVAELEDLTIMVPESSDDAVDLERSAKIDIQKRNNVSMHKWQMTKEQRATTDEQKQRVQLFFAEDQDEEPEPGEPRQGLEHYSLTASWPRVKKRSVCA